MAITGMATTDVPRSGGMRTRAAAWVSAMRAVCTGTADAGNLRRRVAMRIVNRNAAAIHSTAIAIVATTTAVMTIAVTMTAAMTAAANLIRRATPARIVNP